MPDQSLPAGVERFKAPPDRNGRPIPMRSVEDGPYIAVSDLPKIEAQVWERFREAVLSEEAVEALTKSRHERARMHTGERPWSVLSEPVQRTPHAQAGDDLQAALDKAEELMEGESDGE